MAAKCLDWFLMGLIGGIGFLIASGVASLVANLLAHGAAAR